MNDWRNWDLQTWNERLLVHFFRRNFEAEPPVVVVLVTADELAHVTDDVNANPDDVRDAFVDTVRRGIRRPKSLLEHASDYFGWPDPPAWEASPRFLAHLLFTCIAASESSDDLSEEGSFVSRLRDLTQDQLPDHSLQLLPRLWENLSAWLEANRSRYRPLRLPDPGAFTRIGYTVKLAFPDRRDQKQLSELLDRAGLAGLEPPIGRVLSLVASERARYRRSFLLAFDEFRRSFEASAGQAAPWLRDHRFWAAVREASLRGRGQVGFQNTTVRLSFLGEEEEDRLALFVVADQRAGAPKLTFAELPIAYGSWRFAIIPSGSDALDADQLERIVQATLDGSMRLPGLSNYVDQGLLPFAVGNHGLLELAGPEQLEEVSIALVREALVEDLLRVFDRRTATIRPSSYHGWVQVSGLSLHTLPSADLDGTALNRTWVLQESFSRMSLRLLGGVRADDGWLGMLEVLPRIVAPEAMAVALDGPAGSEALTAHGDGKWGLPNRDLVGEFTLVASLDGGTERRTVRFHAAPASEAFKPPTDSEAWIVEEVSGTGTLSKSPPFVVDSDGEDCGRLCERVAYLGSDVGAFVTTADSAAWRISYFGGRYFGARGALRDGAAMPSGWIASANARRRWRKMLFESVPSMTDPDFDAARRRVKGRTLPCSHLPTVDLEQSVPDLAPKPLSSPMAAVDRLLRIVAGRATTRSGLDWSEWAGLAQRVLDIDAKTLQRLTRSWMEAGLIDVASSARWWHRRVFVRPPRFLAFKIGELVGASLSGLALTTTVDEARRAALSIGAAVEDRFSVSALVPRTIGVRADNARVLADLARRCKVDLYWIDLNQLKSGTPSRHDGTSAPPSHYERTTLWSHWSLKRGEFPSVIVEHCMRRDRPDYWLVRGNGRRLWFYDLNVARAWASALLSEPIVTAANAIFLEANHAFLPLSIARTTAILGSGLPGPTDLGRYLYPLGTLQLQTFTLDIVSQTFDPSRLAKPASEQTTG